MWQREAGGGTRREAGEKEEVGRRWREKEEVIGCRGWWGVAGEGWRRLQELGSVLNESGREQERRGG